MVIGINNQIPTILISKQIQIRIIFHHITSNVIGLMS